VSLFSSMMSRMRYPVRGGRPAQSAIRIASNDRNDGPEAALGYRSISFSIMAPAPLGYTIYRAKPETIDLKR
jgi:hypothetical protein